MRGFKIGKPSTGKKIDLVIALAMSALAAVRHNRDGFGIFEYYRVHCPAWFRPAIGSRRRDAQLALHQ